MKLSIIAALTVAVAIAFGAFDKTDSVAKTESAVKSYHQQLADI